MILFATAGIPLCAKTSGMLEGLKKVRELGLDACEWEFVRGVRYNRSHAKEVGEAAARNKVSLSCHAPYYLNLLSDELKKKAYSKHLILESARMLSDAVKAGAPCGPGGGRVVFHAGYYGKLDKKRAAKEMLVVMRDVVEKMKMEKLATTLGPELTGKLTQWGSFEELVELASEFSLAEVNPTIDFAHYLARGNGLLKTKEDYEKVFDALEKGLGKKVLKNLHMHFTSVFFSEKGERHHLTIDKNQPPFKPLAEALKERKCEGMIVSESPTNEADALLMKKIFEKA